MEIIQADSSHKRVVIYLLDEFISVCYKIIKSDKKLSTRENYENIVFDDIIHSSKSAIFLAKD